MILQQFYLQCLAHASYVVGDESSGAAVVVDPQRDVRQYLDFASERGLRITHVVLTHFHADFVAGHLDLRDRTGATICLGRAARAEYPFLPLGDGSVISLGRIELRALETPGHTAESISLVVYDLERSSTEPQAVLTGDTLFVGDVGRPDLRVALGWSASTLGGLLYDSLRNKLLALPDSTAVYPAHGAGSLCGRAISQETVSTIGAERLQNYALQPMARDEFVDLVTADQPDAPPYFTYDAVLNTRERPTLDQSLSRGLTALTLDRVLAARAEGAQLLDTRDPAEFAAAHLAGSVNIGLAGQYATWAGTVLDHDRPIVLITDPERETESALRLGRIGFDNVAGYLEGGLASLAARPDLTATTERLSPAVAQERMASDQPLVLDVRTSAERAARSLPGSMAMPLSQLRQRLGELPRDRPLLVYCAGGYRSAIATSLLAREGFRDVSEIAGGIAAWEHAGQPLAQ
jgi:glyoxylase-like metal-dependent hydrolase (beta-lactamase superfamily II)/rhodanese-related sulfurtransferase